MEKQKLKDLFEGIYEEEVYLSFQSNDNELRIFILELLENLKIDPKKNEDFIFLNLIRDESELLKVNQTLIFIENDLYVISKNSEDKGYQVEIIPNFEVEHIKVETNSNYHLEIDSMEFKISGCDFKVYETLREEHLIDLVNRLKEV